MRDGTTTIVLADDHPVFRHGARNLLELDAHFRIVGEAADGSAALAVVCMLRPDILLLDIAMPKLDGLEALPEILKASADTRVILVTAGIGQMDLLRALQHGVAGVLLKDAAPRLLSQAVRAVASGAYWIGPGSVSDLVGALTQLVAPPIARPFGLTARELEIIAAVVSGDSNRGIADRLDITEQTVKHHLSNIFVKLNVSNRVELTLLAIRRRLTPDPF